MIVTEEVYLEHHGVKGMRWGERRAARKERFGKLTGKQKVGVAGASVAGALIGHKIGGVTGSSLLSVAGTGAGALAGAGFVYKHLANHGHEGMTLPQNHPKNADEAHRQIQAHLARHSSGG